MGPAHALEQLYAGRSSDTEYVDLDQLAAFLARPKKSALFERIAETNQKMALRLGIPEVERMLGELAWAAQERYARISSADGGVAPPPRIERAGRARPGFRRRCRCRTARPRTPPCASTPAAGPWSGSASWRRARRAGSSPRASSWSRSAWTTWCTRRTGAARTATRRSATRWSMRSPARPHHGWDFALATGASPGVPGAAITRFAATIEDGLVWVDGAELRAWRAAHVPAFLPDDDVADRRAPRARLGQGPTTDGNGVASGLAWRVAARRCRCAAPGARAGLDPERRPDREPPIAVGRELGLATARVATWRTPVVADRASAHTRRLVLGPHRRADLVGDHRHRQPAAVAVAQPVEVADAAGRRRADPQPRAHDQGAGGLGQHQALGGDPGPAVHADWRGRRLLVVRAGVAAEDVVAREVEVDAGVGGRVGEQQPGALDVDVLGEGRRGLAHLDVAHAGAVHDQPRPGLGEQPRHRRLVEVDAAIDPGRPGPRHAVAEPDDVVGARAPQRPAQHRASAEQEHRGSHRRGRAARTSRPPTARPANRDSVRSAVMSRARLVLGLSATLALAACTGGKRALELEPLDGTALQAKAYLAEVYGKSGKVITARMEVHDPAGRALAGALVAGRCPHVGAFVDTIPISSATGHFLVARPRRAGPARGHPRGGGVRRGRRRPRRPHRPHRLRRS